MPQQKFIALSEFSQTDFAAEAIMTTDNGSDIFCAIWQRQSGSSFSLEPDQIQKRLSRFQAELRDLKILGYAFCPAMVIWFAYWLVFTTQPIITRIGLLLLVLGMSFWVGQVWLYSRDHRKALANSEATGQTSCVEFYRAVLVRQRDFHRGGWFWSRLFALYAGLFFTMWEPLHHWHGRGNAPRAVNLLVISILAILAVWLNYRKSRKLQQRIDSIDAIKQADEAGPF
jgi:cbb3-type cytochrome oxidase subunit 3